MMFWGLISFIQITFLPGYLATLFLKRDEGPIHILALSLVLSLLINYHLVLGLVIVNLYTKEVLIAVFATECALLLYFVILKLRFPPVKLVSASHYSFFKELNSFPVMLAIIFLVGFLLIYFSTVGSVFRGWDDTLSWNRWAIEWYNGTFPNITYHYPQVLPTNWSMTYVFIGDSKIQFFAKASSTIFAILTLLVVFSHWIRSKKREYLYATSILAIFFLLFSCGIFINGYADVPIAIMALLAFILLQCDTEYLDYKNKDLLVFTGLLVCICAALTKQSGIYFAVIYPVLAYHIVYKKEEIVKKRYLPIVFQYLFLATIILPWYVYSEIKIKHGINESEISYVTSEIYQDRHLFQRPGDAVVILFDTAFENVNYMTGIESYTSVATGTAIFLIVCIFMAVRSIEKIPYRYIMLLIVMPYTILWSFFFGYDARNLTPVFPFVAICTGYGIYEYLLLVFGNKEKKLNEIKQRSFSNKIYFKSGYLHLLLIILFGLFATASAYLVDDDTLINRQRHLQGQIGEPVIRDLLYSLQWDADDERIITDYQLSKHLPDLQERIILLGDENGKEFYETLENNNVRYLYLSPSPEIIDELIEASVQDGSFIDVGLINGRHFLKR